jgi:hypothetical protein
MGVVQVESQLDPRHARNTRLTHVSQGRTAPCRSILPRRARGGGGGGGCVSTDWSGLSSRAWSGIMQSWKGFTEERPLIPRQPATPAMIEWCSCCVELGAWLGGKGTWASGIAICLESIQLRRYAHWIYLAHTTAVYHLSRNSYLRWWWWWWW